MLDPDSTTIIQTSRSVTEVWEAHNMETGAHGMIACSPIDVARQPHLLGLAEGWCYRPSTGYLFADPYGRMREHLG